MAQKKSKTLYIDVNVDEEGIISKFLKKKKPKSIYSLSKLLKRDFKSVYSDLKLLERFGFIEFHSEKRGKREALMPVLNLDKLVLEISI